MSTPFYVYIAGPYTSPDPAVNTCAAMKLWHELADLGCAPFCPHLYHFLQIQQARPYEEWLLQDIHWLRKCDALLRFPGQSSGADKEVALAVELGIPIFYSVEQVSTYMTHIWEGRG